METPTEPAAHNPYGEAPRQATWAILVHLAALTSFFIPFGNIILPLVIWLAKRDNDAKVREHGRASLNFQLTMSVVGSIVLMGALAFLISSGALFTSALSNSASKTLLTALAANLSLLIFLALTLAALSILNLVMIITNAVPAYEGREPRH